MELVNFEHKSKSIFFCQFDQGFKIFPDQKRILGVEYKKFNSLLVEDITIENSSYSFGLHSNWINTIIPNNNFSQLLIGDQDGYMIQYIWDQVNEKYILSKDFGNLGIGSILTGVCFKNFTILGGSKSFLGIIDTKNNKILKGLYQVSVQTIYSIRIGEYTQNESKNFRMIIVGNSQDYSKSLTDIFTINFTFLENYKKNNQLKINELKPKDKVKQKAHKKNEFMINKTNEKSINLNENHFVINGATI